MNETNYKFKDNSSKIAEKAPFDIVNIESLMEGRNLVHNYIGIITSFLHKHLEQTKGFKSLSHQSLGGTVVSKYLFKGAKSPAIKQWTCFDDEPSKRYIKGDAELEIMGSESLEQNVKKKFFEMFQEIESHDYIPKKESEVSPLDMVYEFKGRISSFRYFNSSEGDKYFEYIYSNAIETKKALKSMI